MATSIGAKFNSALESSSRDGYISLFKPGEQSFW